MAHDFTILANNICPGGRDTPGHGGWARALPRTRPGPLCEAFLSQGTRGSERRCVHRKNRFGARPCLPQTSPGPFGGPGRSLTSGTRRSRDRGPASTQASEEDTQTGAHATARSRPAAGEGGDAGCRDTSCRSGRSTGTAAGLCPLPGARTVLGTTSRVRKSGPGPRQPGYDPPTATPQPCGPVGEPLTFPSLGFLIWEMGAVTSIRGV